MSDRLPPEIAALDPQVGRVSFPNLTLNDVRGLLTKAAARIADLVETAAEYKDSGKADLMRARRSEAALRELVTLKAIKEEIDARPNQSLHEEYLRRKPKALAGASEALAAVPPAVQAVKDTNRCACCGWPLAVTQAAGCMRGDCSMRPLPEPMYDAERYRLEQGRGRAPTSDNPTAPAEGAVVEGPQG